MIPALILFMAMGQQGGIKCQEISGSEFCTCPTGNHAEMVNHVFDCVKDQYPTSATFKITGAGKLNCNPDTQHVEGDGKSEAVNHCVDDKPAPLRQSAEPIGVMQQMVNTTPLKCGKYQHIELKPTSPCESLPSDICYIDATPHCVNDMHVVTEKEWQHLGDTIKAQEEMIRILAGQIKELQHDLQTMPVTK